MRETGIFELEKIDRITWREYTMIKRASALRRVDKEREMAQQAIYILASKSTDDSGKYYKYNTAKKLYDYELAEAQLFGRTIDDITSEQEKAKARLFARLNEKGG